MAGPLRPILLLSAALGDPQARAAEADSPPSVFDLSFEELQAVEVVTAARLPQRRQEAPAAVAVITAEDIRAFGYRSVAEALEQVPGLYGVYDFLSTNVGVRGINGGLRAYSRVLKVMIDGELLAFASDASQFLGPELLPMSAVARIEVVRGPSSALYGADAFLGVVNIITREPGAGAPLQLALEGESQGGRGGWGVEGLHRGRSGAWSWLAAASAAERDRSGHVLPSSSPLGFEFEDTRSRGDEARPRNVLARLRHGDAVQESELFLHAYRLDSDAEFLDFGALSHDNRVALRQDTARLSHRRSLSEASTLALSLSHGEGGPDDGERLSLGLVDSFPARDFGFSLSRLSAELQYRFAGRDVLSLGLDASEDREEGLRVFNVAVDGGERVLVAGDGETRVLRNRGLYLQYITFPWERWGLTANLRTDRHNRFAEETHYRLGLVGEPGGGHALKLLYGTAFKAPSALQLYAVPLYPGEILGNAELRSESARSLELAWHWQNAGWEVSANAYRLTVEDKVELLPFGPNQRPQNRDRQEGWGAEGELRWRRGAQELSGQLAWADTDDLERVPFLGRLRAPTASYPRLTARLAWQYRGGAWGDFGASLRYVSERRASKSNARENFLEPYELAPYTLLRLSWHRDFGLHGLAVSASNALDEAYEEPGYNGVDIPGEGRSWRLAYRYRWE